MMNGSRSTTMYSHRIAASAGPFLAVACVVLVATSCDSRRIVLPSQSSAVSASPGANALSLSGPNIARHVQSTRVRELSRRAVQGSRGVGGRCGVAIESTLRKGEHSLQWVAEMDTVTCQSVIASGERTAPRSANDTVWLARTARSSLPQSAPGPAFSPMSSWAISQPTLARTQMAIPRARQDGVGGCSNEVWGAENAELVSWTDDPINLTVNNSRVLASIYFNYTCVQSVISWHTMWWQNLTGWSLTFNYHEQTAPLDRSSALVFTQANYSNLLFCDPTLWTYTYYAPDQLTIYPDGRVTFYSWAASSGDCSSFLSSYHEHSIT